MGGKERRVAGLNAIDAIIPVVAVLVRRRTFWTITSRRISRLVLNWLCWSWDVISIGHLAQTAATRFYISGNRNTNIYKSVGVFLKCTIIASSSSYCPLFFPAFDSTLSACRARGQELDFFFLFFEPISGSEHFERLFSAIKWAIICNPLFFDVNNRLRHT